jgi:ketosteroid isomerase-like protein
MEVVKRGFAHFQRAGDFLEEIVAPDFIWDMSKFDGWPEQPRYEGIEGARAFLRDWTEPFDDWRLEVEAFHEAGERVVVILRQHGRSRASGMPVEMHLGQVWDVRDGKQLRVEVYASPAEALKAAGLEA